MKLPRGHTRIGNRRSTAPGSNLRGASWGPKSEGAAPLATNFPGATRPTKSITISPRGFLLHRLARGRLLPALQMVSASRNQLPPEPQAGRDPSYGRSGGFNLRGGQLPPEIQRPSAPRNTLPWGLKRRENHSHRAPGNQTSTCGGQVFHRRLRKALLRPRMVFRALLPMEAERSPPRRRATEGLSVDMRAGGMREAATGTRSLRISLLEAAEVSAATVCRGKLRHSRSSTRLLP